MRACNIIARVSAYKIFTPLFREKSPIFCPSKEGGRGRKEGRKGEREGNACVRDKSDH